MWQWERGDQKCVHLISPLSPWWPIVSISGKVQTSNVKYFISFLSRMSSTASKKGPKKRSKTIDKLARHWSPWPRLTRSCWTTKAASLTTWSDWENPTTLPCLEINPKALAVVAATTHHSLKAKTLFMTTCRARLFSLLQVQSFYSIESCKICRKFSIFWESQKSKVKIVDGRNWTKRKQGFQSPKVSQKWLGKFRNNHYFW